MAASVLISGANGGIGESLCTAFSQAGYSVIATDIHDQPKTPTEHYLPLNLAEFSASAVVRAQFARNLKPLLADGKLAVLVNNAATQILGSIDALSVEDFSTTMAINVTAPFALSQLCLPYLEKAGGSIVNIGSIHASLTKPQFIAYASSKAALAGLTRATAVELAPKGIRVNAIQPAAIETEMLLAGFKDNPSGYADLKSYHPTNQLGLPSEVADLAVYISSKTQSKFLTGATIDLSGGIHARLHDPD